MTDRPARSAVAPFRARVVRALAVLAIAASATAAMAADGREDGFAAQLGALVNAYRAQHDRKPLALVPALSALAQEHAGRMANDRRLSHDGFDRRFANARSPHCVENVAAGTRTPQATFEAWRHSPEHDHNLLDAEIARMGIAIERGYVAFFACR